MRKRSVALVSFVVFLSACSHAVDHPENLSDSSFVFSKPVILKGVPGSYRFGADTKTSHTDGGIMKFTHRINASEDELVQEKHALIEEEEFRCRTGEVLLKSRYANGHFREHIFLGEQKGIDKKDGYERIIYNVSCETDYIPLIKKTGGKK